VGSLPHVPRQPTSVVRGAAAIGNWASRSHGTEEEPFWREPGGEIVAVYADWCRWDLGGERNGGRAREAAVGGGDGGRREAAAQGSSAKRSGVLTKSSAFCPSVGKVSDTCARFCWVRTERWISCSRSLLEREARDCASPFT
jgi:hypothetical protein